jgi:hypothetical protein
VFIVVGDFDIMDGPTGQYAWIKQMNWYGHQEFENSKRMLYFYNSDDLNE